eukprot:4310894-Pleurochrysis_carterae.AAC.1
MITCAARTALRAHAEHERRSRPLGINPLACVRWRNGRKVTGRLAGSTDGVTSVSAKAARALQALGLILTEKSHRRHP